MLRVRITHVACHMGSQSFVRLAYLPLVAVVVGANRTSRMIERLCTVLGVKLMHVVRLMADSVVATPFTEVSYVCSHECGCAFDSMRSCGVLLSFA